MAKNVILCFDGTCNDPEDSVPNGMSHEQRALTHIKRAVLADRDFRVRVKNRHSTRKPILHHTVFDRMAGTADYRPASLLPDNMKHPLTDEVVGMRVWYSPDEICEFEPGRTPRVHRGQNRMEVGPRKTRCVRVFARRLYNPSGLLVRPGEAYKFSVDKSQSWRDGSIECGPKGWDRESVELGIVEFAIRLKEDNRRVPQAKWFEVIGTVNQEDAHAFRVLEYTDVPWYPKVDGELFFFANDLLDKYDNNLGDIEIIVERLK